MTTGRTWDALPCDGLTESALDRRAVEDFLNRAGQDTKASTESVLTNLRLRLPDGSLCNAAALLFAALPFHFLTGVQVKCGRFRGTTSIDFLDERTLEGNVITQLEEALVFVARNTRQEFRITGRPEREVVPEYPEDAIREAITNAICHRDYPTAGTVQVRIYEDRLEVWNPAILPGDLTLEQLYHAHTSHPRNRKLAEAFYRARLIEHWGTGTLRMIRACEARSMPPPEFRYEMGSFIVRFFPAPISPTIPDLSNLNERQKRVLTYVHEHGTITTAQYVAFYGVTDRQARRDLTVLVERNLLIRVGSGPTTHYIDAMEGYPFG
jgi:ATP-dependent DNA helicase RecG